MIVPTVPPTAPSMATVRTIKRMAPPPVRTKVQYNSNLNCTKIGLERDHSGGGGFWFGLAATSLAKHPGERGCMVGFAEGCMVFQNGRSGT